MNYRSVCFLSNCVLGLMCLGGQAWGQTADTAVPTPNTVAQSGVPTPQNTPTKDSDKTALIAHYQTLANQKNLAEHKVWQRLFYGNDGTSRVTYDGFFVHPDGKNDLNAELYATLDALFNDTSENSPQCRFPARTEWLITMLDLPTDELAKVDCQEFDKWYKQINPHSMTLIFASDYMGNPGSMFGHTLLRIDPPKQAGKNSDLIAYALNYAATPPPNESSAAYAFKGLTGGYLGEFSLMRYFHKVKEYGDLESRDMWEYHLGLSPQEVQFLVKHIWEMKNVHFPYYFMDENCSYALMGLIDLVRPKLDLQAKFGWTVVPIETIKAVDKAGLIASQTYRPALETKIRHQEQNLGTDFGKLAHSLTLPSVTPQTALADFDDANKAKLLELAYDILYLQQGNKTRERAFVQSRLRELLLLRSQLATPKENPAPPTPFDPRLGHGDKAWSVGLGTMQGKTTTTLGHRVAYHSLNDPHAGFLAGQLLFLNGEVVVQDDKVKLNHFDLISVRAISPISTYKRPKSWGTDIGYRQIAIDNQGNFSPDETNGVWAVSSHTGYAKAFFDNRAVCGAYIGGQMQAGKALDKGVRVGLMPKAECLWRASDKVQGTAGLSAPIWHDGSWQARFDGNVQYNVDNNNAVRLSLTHEQDKTADWQSVMVGYQHYF